MKFIHYLEKIAGVEIFPLISLLIFFLFFFLLTVWALRVNKEYIAELKQIPLDNKEEPLNQ
jgi:cytochrome c oxidase cbb3-type subunit 4